MAPQQFAVVLLSIRKPTLAKQMVIYEESWKVRAQFR
jgi:hypothetical protein